MSANRQGQDDPDRTLSRPAVSLEALRARLTERLSDWRRLLRSRPTHGQTALRTLLHGPTLVGMPTAEGVPWTAQGSLRGMLGILSTCLASPICASWNQLDGWLRAVDGLRHAA